MLSFNPQSKSKGSLLIPTSPLDLSCNPSIYDGMDVLTSKPNRLAAQNIKINKSYLLSCTNSRATDLTAAARVFKEASPSKIPDSVKFYIAAASLPKQIAAEEVSGTRFYIISPSEP